MARQSSSVSPYLRRVGGVGSEMSYGLDVANFVSKAEVHGLLGIEPPILALRLPPHLLERQALLRSTSLEGVLRATGENPEQAVVQLSHELRLVLDVRGLAPRYGRRLVDHERRVLGDESLATSLHEDAGHAEGHACADRRDGRLMQVDGLELVVQREAIEDAATRRVEADNYATGGHARPRSNNLHGVPRRPVVHIVIEVVRALVAVERELE